MPAEIFPVFRLNNMELEFLSPSEYYNIVLYQNKYQVIAKDEGLDSILIGISRNGQIFYLDTEKSENDYASYLASDLEIFRKETELFYNFIHNRPQDETEEELKKFADEFRQQILQLDKNAFSDSENYWSVVAEELEWGVI